MNGVNEYNSGQDLLQPADLETEVVYAGFLLRLVAYIIDLACIYLTAILIMLPLQYFLIETSDDMAMILMLILFLGVVLYFPLMESSKWQATLGKRAVRIKVTDMYGQRIGFGKALGRFFGKIVSGMILYIGYIMAAFTERKQALHDLMAGTLVVKA